MLTLLLIVSLSIKKNYNRDNKYLKYLLLLFLIFFINATISSFKSSIQYHSYYTYCFLILVGVCSNNFSHKISKYFLSFLILTFIYNNLVTHSAYYKELFKRKNSVIDICKEVKTGKISKNPNANINFLKYWHNKFDDNAIEKLCFNY